MQNNIIRNSAMRYIGVTGGIGSGKSEILSYIKKHYRCEIYLADEVAHQVKKSGTPCFQALINLLGNEVIGEDGEIDKAVMADKIFESPKILEQVNAIVHPAVKTFLSDKLEVARRGGQVELFFVEAALLIETGYKQQVDEMWYIYADEQTRRERLRTARGYSDEKISRILKSQLTEEEFRKACDFVIDNSGALADSYRQIDKKLEAFTWQE